MVRIANFTLSFPFPNANSIDYNATIMRNSSLVPDLVSILLDLSKYKREQEKTMSIIVKLVHRLMRSGTFHS